jgi:hypothetical protein
MDKISAIETVSFRMKDDEKKQTEFGVIAQQLETIFPELVRTSDDEMGTKSVNYIGLIAPMIEATKDLKAENEVLKGQIKDLQSDNAAIHASLSGINQQLDQLNRAALGGVNKASFDGGFSAALLLAIGALLGALGTALLRRKLFS